jgi:hypothetical protein
MPDTLAETRSNLDACVDLCQSAHRACVETMLYCLGRGGAYADADHIRLLADCADICQATADFMLRESPLHGSVCAVCAEVCDQCAVECDAFADNGRLEHCAQLCRQCAATCEQMAGM